MLPLVDRERELGIVDTLVIPEPQPVHAVRGVGKGNAAELATYVVEKGKPILTLVE
jgi:hypothetical protein